MMKSAHIHDKTVMKIEGFTKNEERQKAKKKN